MSGGQAGWGILSQLVTTSVQQVFGCFLKQKRTLPAPTEGERRASEPVHKRQRTAPAATPLKDHQATGSASFQRRNKPVGSGFVFRDPNLSHSVDRIVAHPPRRPEKENGHPAAAQRSLSFQGSVHEAHAGIIAASPGAQPATLASLPRGLLNPQQLRIADEHDNKMKSLRGLQTLRSKASSPDSSARPQVSLRFSEPALNQDSDAQDGCVQMIGETVSKPSPADVVGSLSWQESRRKLISEKERVAAEQRLTADRNKERKAAEMRRLWEAENESSLLVDKAAAEEKVKLMQEEKLKLTQDILSIEEQKTALEAQVEDLKQNDVRQMDLEQLQQRLADLQTAMQPSAQGPPSPLDLATQGVDEELLMRICKYFHKKDVVVDKYDIDITREKIEVMSMGTWLSSEVITWWLEWWREQTGGGSQKEMPKGMDGVGKNWFANTYFYSKLVDNGTYTYKNVKRWTKKINIFECDKMIIPINQQDVHWYCACINFAEKRTEVYDSMGPGKHPEVHEHLMRWLRDEHLDKRGSPLDEEGWTHWYPSENGVHVPKQENGYDCGVFASMFAASVSLNRPFDFTQDDIQLIRRWMVQVMYKEGEKMGCCAHPGLCN